MNWHLACVPLPDWYVSVWQSLHPASLRSYCCILLHFCQSICRVGVVCFRFCFFFFFPNTHDAVSGTWAGVASRRSIIQLSLPVGLHGTAGELGGLGWWETPANEVPFSKAPAVTRALLISLGISHVMISVAAWVGGTEAQVKEETFLQYMKAERGYIMAPQNAGELKLQFWISAGFIKVLYRLSFICGRFQMGHALHSFIKSIPKQMTSLFWYI